MKKSTFCTSSRSPGRYSALKYSRSLESAITKLRWLGDALDQKPASIHPEQACSVCIYNICSGGVGPVGLL